MKKLNTYDIFQYSLGFIFLMVIILALMGKLDTHQGPKILMLCSAPGQDCEPYIQPQPFTGYNNSGLYKE